MQEDIRFQKNSALFQLQLKIQMFKIFENLEACNGYPLVPIKRNTQSVLLPKVQETIDRLRPEKQNDFQNAF